MIYLDASVLLARAFAEEVAPSDALWGMPLISSRLLLYEVWTRVHARPSRLSHRGDVENLLDRVRLVRLGDDVLERALHPYPLSLCTLDALHLATLEFLRLDGAEVTLASYDRRLLAAARAIGIEAASL